MITEFGIACIANGPRFLRGGSVAVYLEFGKIESRLRIVCECAYIYAWASICLWSVADSSVFRILESRESSAAMRGRFEFEGARNSMRLPRCGRPWNARSESRVGCKWPLSSADPSPMSEGDSAIILSDTILRGSPGQRRSSEWLRVFAQNHVCLRNLWPVAILIRVAYPGAILFATI